MQMRFVSEDGRTLVVEPDDDGDGVKLEMLPAPPAEQPEADEVSEDQAAEGEPGPFHLARLDTRLLGNQLVVLAKSQARGH